MSDLISRQVAIEAICKACGMEEDYHKCDGYPEESTWCDKLVALRAVPSAEPEQKTAKWIKCGYWSEGVGMGETYGSCYKCSECGIEVQSGEDRCGMNFCHNCGAKMVVNDT